MIDTYPVGSIVASMLPADRFVHLNSGWRLADGADVSGTAYGNAIGQNLPDLRGVFLRGRNYGRDNATGNADGDLPIGTHQRHQIASHSHDYQEMVLDNNVDGVDSSTRNSYEHNPQTRQTGATGGGETRPNCVTINYFIRVD